MKYVEWIKMIGIQLHEQYILAVATINTFIDSISIAGYSAV